MKTNDKPKKRRPLWKKVLMWTGVSVAGLIAVVIVLVAVFTPESEESSSQAVFSVPEPSYADLREAVKWGTLNDVKDAVEAGADFDARDGLGETPLHWVARNSKTPKEIMRLVLKYVDDPNVRDDAGKTPLHLAAEFGNPPAAEVLLEEGADPCLRDDAGKTPYDRAIFPSEQRALNRVGLKADCN